MTPLASTKVHSLSLSRFHPYNRSSHAVIRPHVPRSSPSLSAPAFAKPFDRFIANGGGASGDIFRRFKIQRSEEEDFIVHWVRQPLSPGLLTRDDNGVLIFRVSSSDISHLSVLGIGHPVSEMENGVEVTWTHVYDEQGVSWLSRCRGIDYSTGDIHICNMSDEEYERIIRERNGVIGVYGPSGQTIAEFPRPESADGRGEQGGQSSSSESD